MDQFSGFSKSAEISKVRDLNTSIELLENSKQLLMVCNEDLKLLEDDSLAIAITNLENQISNLEKRIVSITSLKASIISTINSLENERIRLLREKEEKIAF